MRSIPTIKLIRKFIAILILHFLMYALPFSCRTPGPTFAELANRTHKKALDAKREAYQKQLKKKNFKKKTKQVKKELRRAKKDLEQVLKSPNPTYTQIEDIKDRIIYDTDVPEEFREEILTSLTEAQYTEDMGMKKQNIQTSMNNIEKALADKDFKDKVKIDLLKKMDEMGVGTEAINTKMNKKELEKVMQAYVEEVGEEEAKKEAKDEISKRAAELENAAANIIEENLEDLDDCAKNYISENFKDIDQNTNLDMLRPEIKQMLKDCREDDSEDAVNKVIESLEKSKAAVEAVNKHKKDLDEIAKAARKAKEEKNAEKRKELAKTTQEESEKVSKEIEEEIVQIDKNIDKSQRKVEESSKNLATINAELRKSKCPKCYCKETIGELADTSEEYDERCIQLCTDRCIQQERIKKEKEKIKQNKRKKRSLMALKFTLAAALFALAIFFFASGDPVTGVGLMALALSISVSGMGNGDGSIEGAPSDYTVPMDDNSSKGGSQTSPGTGNKLPPKVKIEERFKNTKETINRGKIEANITNAKQKGIEVKVNGKSIEDFKYNSDSGGLVIDETNLKQGKNSIEINATNEEGVVSSDKANFNYDGKNLPGVSFDIPDESSTNGAYKDISGIIEHIDDETDISIEVNGETHGNLKYSPETNQLEMKNLKLKKGDNKIVITATNDKGSSTKELSIGYLNARALPGDDYDYQPVGGQYLKVIHKETGVAYLGKVPLTKDKSNSICGVDESKNILWGFDENGVTFWSGIVKLKNNTISDDEENKEIRSIVSRELRSVNKTDCNVETNFEDCCKKNQSKVEKHHEQSEQKKTEEQKELPPERQKSPLEKELDKDEKTKESTQKKDEKPVRFSPQEVDIEKVNPKDITNIAEQPVNFKLNMAKGERRYSYEKNGKTYVIQFEKEDDDNYFSIWQREGNKNVLVGRIPRSLDIKNKVNNDKVTSIDFKLICNTIPFKGGKPAYMYAIDESGRTVILPFMQESETGGEILITPNVKGCNNIEK